MGRRHLSDASAMAKMWGFVALTLGALSFIQAHAYVAKDAARASELPVEACSLANPAEYALEAMQLPVRAAIEHLTGLARVDLSARPVKISSTTQGIILQTESRRSFRLSRQMVQYKGARYYPLIARALETCGELAPGNEAYVISLSEADLGTLKTIVAKSRGYCTGSPEFMQPSSTPTLANPVPPANGTMGL